MNFLSKGEGIHSTKKEIAITDSDFKKLLGTRDRQNRVALDLIKYFSNKISQIPSYKGSPIVENIGTALANTEEVNDKPATIISKNPRTLRDSFRNSWVHYLNIIGIPKDLITELTSLSVAAMSLLKNSDLHPSDMFMYMLKKEKVMARKGELPLAETIVGRAGVYSNNLEIKKTNSVSRGTTLKRSFAKSILCFLNNQEHMAGYYDGKRYHTGSKSEDAKAILDNITQSDQGWSMYVKNISDIDDLNTHCTSVDRSRNSNTHDQSIIFNDKDELDLLNINFGIRGLSDLPVRIYSANGDYYYDTNAQFILELPSDKLEKFIEEQSLGTETVVGWKSIKGEENDKNWPIFALSLSSNNQNYPSTPAADGKILTHIHLDTHSSTNSDTLYLFTGHIKDDGVNQSYTLNQIETSISREIIRPTKRFIRLNTKLSQLEAQTPELIDPSKIIERFAPRDVTVGRIFNADQLALDLVTINTYFNTDNNFELIDGIMRSPEYNAQLLIYGNTRELPDDSHEIEMGQLESMRLIKSDPSYKSIENQAYVAKFIKSTLNPNLSRVDMFARRSEIQSGPTTICNYPVSFLKRLTLSLVKKSSSHRLDSAEKMEEALSCAKTTAIDRSLSKIGLGPLAFLTTFTSEAQQLAERSGRAFKEALVHKTMITTQISDIVKSGHGYFVSALSSFRKSLSRSIGITEDRITSRCNISKIDYVNQLKFITEVDQTIIKEVAKSTGIPFVHIKAFETTIKQTLSQLESEITNEEVIKNIFNNIPQSYLKSYILGLQGYLICKQVEDLDELVSSTESDAAILANYTSKGKRVLIQTVNT